MAEAPSGRLPVGDGGQGARRQGDPRRPAVHPHAARWPTSTSRSAPGTDIAFLGGLINYILDQRAGFREYVARLHQRRPLIVERGLPGHRGPRRPVLRLRPRDATTTDQATLAVRGHPSGDGRQRRGARRRSARRGGGRGDAHGRRRGRVPAESAARRDAAGSALRLPDPQAALRPLHARDGRARSAACPPEQFLQVCRGAVTANSGRERTTALVYAVGWTQHTVGVAVHPRRRDPPAAARQHRPARRRHHGAARPRQHPGLDRHPDPVQPAARLPADAARRRSTRPRRLRRASTATSRRASGRNADAVHRVSLLKAWWGDAATPDNDFCFDYLPRITATTAPTATVHGHDRRQGQGLLPARPEPGGRLGQRPAAAARHGQPRLAGRARPGR